MKYALLIPLAAALVGSRQLRAESPHLPLRQRVHQQRRRSAGQGLQAHGGRQRHGRAKARASTATRPCRSPPRRSRRAPAQRVDADDQRARDADARAILEAELKKAEARQAELLKEYNNGEPEKLGPEHRNHQKYLDRVAELKASIARNESDIAGLKRELGRVAASK